MTEEPFNKEMFPFILVVHSAYGIAEGIKIYCRSKFEAERIRLEIIEKSPKGLEAIYLYLYAELWGDN